MNEMEQVEPAQSLKKPVALLISGIVACIGVGIGIYFSYEHNLAYQNAVEKTTDAKSSDTISNLTTQAAAQDGAGGISIGQGDEVQGTAKQRQTASTSTAGDTKAFALPKPTAAQVKAPAAPPAVANCDWPQAINIPKQITELLMGEVCAGSGADAVADKSVTINYNGMLLDGTLFDSSYIKGKPLTFIPNSGGVIPGMAQGVLGMKVGGKRVLVLPPNLAYGANPPVKSIPPNSTLVFQVELLATNQPVSN